MSESASVPGWGVGVGVGVGVAAWGSGVGVGGARGGRARAARAVAQVMAASNRAVPPAVKLAGGGVPHEQPDPAGRRRQPGHGGTGLVGEEAGRRVPGRRAMTAALAFGLAWPMSPAACHGTVPLNPAARAAPGRR